MYIGVVLRIQEHQSRRNNTSMPKMLLVHLKKEEQGRGTLKNSSTSPENISEVVFFLHLNGILMHLQLQLQCTREIIF